ncbi:MAG: hypothetical protein R3B99_03020 [Polyangiales bacterium]|nr:hypothetical protein [Myxococcales bacterium]MCB9622141.1 hypothetical protein [Sandaracinus sp.]
MTRILVLLAGLGGLAVVARAGAYYQGTDGFAFTLVSLMAVVLLGGLLELWMRASRIASLQGAIDALRGKEVGKLDEVDGALRPILRSHLERDPMPAQVPVFAPFLVGLLVLLGLLGTFLGLFETLGGARAALETGGDIDSLRAGLTRPMGGLMRSFGTSAAGVAASAMLGLGAVFVRRAARRLDESIHAACAGPLAHLSASRRQLVALEELAEQGRALPDAVASLRDAVHALDGLATAHRAANDALREAGSKEIAEVRQMLSKDAQALLTRVDELSRRVDTARADEAKLAAERDAKREAGQAELAKRWSEGHARTAEALTKAASEAGATVAGRLEKLSDRLESLEARLAERDAQVAERSEQAVKSVVAATADELRGVSAGLSALESTWREAHAEAARRQEAELRHAVDAVREALAGTAEEVAVRAAQATEPVLTRAAEATRQAATEHLNELRALAEREAAERRTEEAARMARGHEAIDRVLARIEEDATARRAEDDTRAARTEAATSTLLARLDDETTRRREADAALVERLVAESTRLREADEQRVARVLAGVEKLAEAQRAVADEAASRDASRAEQLAAVATHVEQELGRASQALRAEAERSAEREAQRETQLRSLVEALGGAAGSVGEAAGRQAQALEGLVEEARERLVVAEARTAEKLDALLAKVADAVEAQRERLADLERALADRHEGHVRELSDEMLKRTEALGAGLAETGAIVAQAATLVQSSGAELGAAVEMFSTSVERHADAAQRWLSSLATVERAVEEAGEGAAVDVLGQYLARTHELFDQQLGFQEELVKRLEVAKANGHATSDVDVHA